MMRWLVALIGAGLVPGCGLAAELLPEPASDWRGFYLGGHFGGAFGRSEWFDLGVGNIGAHDASGILGGGQAGYNFQTGPWVWGPQASVSGSSLGGSHIDTVFGFGPVPQPNRGSIDLLGTLTGRLGYAWGPLLLYGQGGAVWAHTRYDLSGFFARDWNSPSATTPNGAGPPELGPNTRLRRTGRGSSNTIISASARTRR